MKIVLKITFLMMTYFSFGQNNNLEVFLRSQGIDFSKDYAMLQKLTTAKKGTIEEAVYNGIKKADPHFAEVLTKIKNNQLELLDHLDILILWNKVSTILEKETDPIMKNFFQGLSNDLQKAFENKQALNDKELNEWLSKKQELDSIKYAKLMVQYSDSIITFDSIETYDYINENLNAIKNSTVGNYELLFDQLGKLTNNKELNFKNLDSNLIKTFSDNDIVIPLPTKISFSVISNDSILVTSSFFANTKKAVFYEKSTNSFFFKEKLNASIIKITRDESIDKNKLKVKYQYKNEKLVNGVLIESVDYPKEEIKEILKK
jgi:hypothetical protein